MTTVAVGAVRSCGVTTLAAGLAATWPTTRRVLVVEADPAGGTLAAGSGWPSEPSLVSLAAAARRGGEPALVWEHCHQLPGGIPALAGPYLAEQAANAVGMLGPLLGRLGELDADAVIDCGRLDPSSPALAVWERADRSLLAVRPRLADLQAVAAWLEGRAGDRPAGLVIVGDGPYPDGEITDALDVGVIGRLPWDPEAAEALLSVPASARQVRLAPLVRAVRTLADHLTDSGDPVPAQVRLPAEPRPAGRHSSVGTRVLRAWRTDSAPRSPNGSVPEEAGR